MKKNINEQNSKDYFYYGLGIYCYCGDNKGNITKQKLIKHLEEIKNNKGTKKE